MKRGFLKSAKAFSNTEPPKNRADVVAQPKNSANRTQIAPTPTVPALHGRDGKLTVDYQDDEWMLSTQPRYPPGASLAEYPDSCSECMITGRAKRKILNTPGFPEPLPRPNPPFFRISDSPGKGLGMFATRDIKMGDLIIAERALLIIPRAAPAGLVPAYPTEEQTRRASAKEYEQYLEVMMQRLPWGSRVAFKQLCNYNRDDGIGPLVSTAGMNSFLIQDYFEPSHGKPGVPEGYGCYGGVFKTLSRINHRQV
ncbi:hypothetical protein VKT23_019475 [Stygiomarasmius scandens]|uniref:SET domain-containing protein n=1 Tax=Marasmiellus scandens TaxID=2682957 RepID=A0ABR1IQ95_9AGAR